MATDKLAADDQDLAAPTYDARPHAPVKRVLRYGLPARLAAEVFGSFFLVIAGVGLSIFGAQGGIPPAMGFGLAVLAGCIAVGHISGAHFNPAITIGVAVAGRMSWKDVLPYIVAQVVGGGFASLILWVVIKGHAQVASQSVQLFSGASNGFGDHSPTKFPLTSALLAEVIVTAVFVAVVLAATSAKANKSLSPLAIGLTFAILIQLVMPITNASLNPARSTATVFFADGWAFQQLWLFWVAPILGALIAGLLFRSADITGRNGKADAGDVNMETTSSGHGMALAVVPAGNQSVTAADLADDSRNDSSPEGDVTSRAGTVDRPDAGTAESGRPETAQQHNARPEADAREEADARQFFDGGSDDADTTRGTEAGVHKDVDGPDDGAPRH